MSIESQRHLFSLDEGVHYLNCAYMSPLLKKVEDVGINGILNKRNPFKISVNDFFDTSEQLRISIAQLINANPSGVSIIPSVSYGMSVVAQNMKFKKGQKIIVVSEEFPSNYYAWERLCEEQDLVLKVICPGDRDCKGKSWNLNVLNAIDENTALISIGHVHWADGTVFNLEAISEKAHVFGTYLIIDGTQSIGALPFDTEKIKPDAIVCAGYKWLMGPYSIGFAWYGDRILKGKPIEDNWISREGSHQFGNLINYTKNYRESAAKFDVGENSNFILLPMFLEAVNQVLFWKPETINLHCRSITREFISELRDAGLKIDQEEYLSPHLFSIPLHEAILGRVQGELSKHKIFVSARGNHLRISPHVYNDNSDIALLRDCLLSLI